MKSKSNTDVVRKSAKKKTKSSYEVGFGKPPKEFGFKTGYDPRRNYHGRPKDIDQIRELIRDIGTDEVELTNGQKVSRIYLKVLEIFGSRDPRDNALLLGYGYGKVPETINLHTWQNEVIQALQENLISPVDVIKTLGLEDAKPLLIAASATIPVDLSAAQESSGINAVDSTTESQ